MSKLSTVKVESDRGSPLDWRKTPGILKAALVVLAGKSGDDSKRCLLGFLVVRQVSFFVEENSQRFAACG